MSQINTKYLLGLIALSLSLQSCVYVDNAQETTSSSHLQDNNNQSVDEDQPDALEVCQSSNITNTSEGILTVVEYRNSLRDLLSIPQADLDDLRLPQQTVGGQLGFDNEAALQKFSGELSYFFEASYAMANRAVAVKYNETVCNNGETLPNCSSRVIGELAYRAYRRPITTPLKNKLMALYNLGADFRSGMANAIRGILISPYFLIKAQRGTNKLDAFDLASRMSFLIWRSLPDNALLAAAANGSLLQDAKLKSEIERLLQNAKSVAYENDFIPQWLQTSGFAESNDPVRRAGNEETRLLFNKIRTGQIEMADIFNGNYSYINNTLATVYGVSGSFDSNFQRVTFGSTDQRKGIISHASVLSASGGQGGRTSPVLRGLYFREKFLCSGVNEPPDTVPQIDEGDLASMSIREVLGEHLKQTSSCFQCHKKMDPYGWPLEHYAQNGAFRSTYNNGTQVEGHSELIEFGNRPVQSPRDLIDYVGNTNTIRSCLVEKHMRFALSRALTEDEKCYARNIGRKILKQPGAKLSDLLKEVVVSALFKGGE